MFFTEIDELVKKLQNQRLKSLEENSTHKCYVDVVDDKTVIAVSVLGHDPKNVEVNYYDDKLEIKAKKDGEDTIYNILQSDIDHSILVSNKLNIKTAQAEIKNGILFITLEKKDEAKPKKLNVKIS